MASSVHSAFSVSSSRCRSDSVENSKGGEQAIQPTPFQIRSFHCRSVETTKKHMQGGALAVYDPYMTVQQQQQLYYYPYQMQFQKPDTDIFLPPVMNMLPTFWTQPSTFSSEIVPYQFSTPFFPHSTTHHQTDFGRLSAPFPSRKVKKKTEKESQSCSHIFCGGIAQLLWIIVGIVVTGMIATLILALMVV